MKKIGFLSVVHYEFWDVSDHSSCTRICVQLRPFHLQSIVTESWSDSICIHGRETHTKLSLYLYGSSVEKAVRGLMRSNNSDCAAPNRRTRNNTSSMLDVRYIEFQVLNHTMCILSNRCIRFASIRVVHVAYVQDLVGASARWSSSDTISRTYIKCLLRNDPNIHTATD